MGDPAFHMRRTCHAGCVVDIFVEMWISGFAGDSSAENFRGAEKLYQGLLLLVTLIGEARGCTEDLQESPSD